MTKKPDLSLYFYDSCPFCQYVLRYLETTDIEVKFRNTLEDQQAYKELLEIGGKTQVPCLVIDGEPLYESIYIVEWLKDYYPRHVEKD